MTDDTKKPVTQPILSQTSSGPSSSDEQPEIYGISKGKNGIVLNRRSFIGALAAAGALAACPPAIAANKPAASLKSPGTGKAHEGTVAGLLMRDAKLYSWDPTVHKTWNIPKGKLDTSYSKDGLQADVRFFREWQRGANLPEIFLHLWETPVLAHGLEGTILALDVEDRTVLWKLSGEISEKLSLKEAPQPVRSLAVHPGGECIAVGSEDGTITFWDLADGALRQTITETANPALSLAFHPNGSLLLSGHQDGKARLWRLPEGKAVKTITHEGHVMHMRISPNGSLAAIAGNGSAIVLLDMPEGKQKSTLTLPLADRLTAMDISEDSQLLATGTAQGYIYLWRLPDGKMLGYLYDETLLEKGTNIAQYRQMGGEIQTRPCDEERPKNAPCVCDCVGDNRMCVLARQVCICDAIAVPAGHAVGDEAVCVCNTNAVGTKRAPASTRPSTSPGGCSCVSHVAPRGRGGGHYWRPN